MDTYMQLPSGEEFLIVGSPHSLEDQEIRLFQFFPGSALTPLEGYLVYTSLLNAPAFDALSWAWGDPSDTQHITINKRRLDIPKTLASALLNLQRETQPLLLWIDYHCIDQTNIQERNHQVRLMGRIYAKAHSVIAW
jgi:hypothetical protein